jgi:hypothetical protein
MTAPAGMIRAIKPCQNSGMKPFEIFRTGTHTSSSGQTLAFAGADLEAIASGYDKSVHHAPIVVGHPKQDNPAYGWIEKLAIVNGRLLATAADVDPAFAELVKTKKFSKVSAAFYAPTSPNNPTPGSYALRHVGFLGAAAPAVKGLKAIEFASGDASEVEIEIEFGESSMMLYRTSYGFQSVSNLFRRLRDRMIASESLEAADQIIPEYEVSALANAANDLRTAANAAEATQYSEPEDNDMTSKVADDEATRLAALTAREEALAAQEAAFAEAHAASLKAQSDALLIEDAAFVDQVVSQGRLPIGMKSLAGAVFTGLAVDDVTFAEGDEQKTLTPRLALRSLLSALPLPVKPGELINGDEPDFSDPAQVKEFIQTEMSQAEAAGKPISAAEAASKIK